MTGWRAALSGMILQREGLAWLSPIPQNLLECATFNVFRSTFHDLKGIKKADQRWPAF
jgi:hypothetical protein